jgi:site-specific recombinase XerD
MLCRSDRYAALPDSAQANRGDRPSELGITRPIGDGRRILAGGAEKVEMSMRGSRLVGDRTRIPVPGPLAVFTDGFRVDLTAQGFTRHVVADHTHLLAHLSGWLAERGLTARDVDADALQRFLSDRRAGGHEFLISARGMAPMLKYLRGLSSCDRTTPLGCRDYAVLMLLSRLGLRNGEVSRLRLDDIDWRAGQMLIRGKGSRNEVLPLPDDVGRALVDYLMHARPPGIGSRAAFVIGRAPFTF